MKTITNVDYGHNLSSKEDWFNKVENEGYYEGIRILSTSKEALEALQAELPKYVKARVGDVMTHFYGETETQNIYYKPKWNSLGIWFINNSKTTNGANETAVKRANKLFALIEKHGIETETQENSIYNFYKHNLDLIEEVSKHDK